MDTSAFLIAHDDEQITPWLEDNKSAFFWMLFGLLFITLLAVMNFGLWAIPLMLPFAHAFIRGALLNSGQDIPLKQNSVSWIVAAYCGGIASVGLGAIILTGHLLYLLMNTNAQKEMEHTLARWMLTFKRKVG